MKFGKILVALSLFLATFALACPDCDKETPDVNAVSLATNNAQIKVTLSRINQLNKSMVEFGENGDIELVIGGEGLKIFTNNDKESKELLESVKKTLKEAKFVRILVCSDCMRKANLKVEQLPQGVKVARSGLRELIDRQLEGYAIIPTN